jgi:predicted DCC family thiol-disulfide oxidoreductase YuxK
MVLGPPPDEPRPFQTASLDRPVVFYVGGCPLCRREISHYRRLDRRGAVE